MAFTLYSIFKAGLLITNGIAILHHKRFLARYGLDQQDVSAGANTLKNQVVAFLQATTFLKIPLIAINCVIILFEAIAG